MTARVPATTATAAALSDPRTEGLAVAGGVAPGIVGGGVAPDGVESAYAGWEIPVVRDGVAPADHTQFGSPSSCPLVKPSPSVSAWHRPVVHARPSAAKADPKELRGPLPDGLSWPTPGVATPLRITLAPLGMAPWYDWKAVAGETHDSATQRTTAQRTETWRMCEKLRNYSYAHLV